MNFDSILNYKISFKGDSFRNIYTIIDSQNLFDDIVVSSTENDEILRKWENNTSGISHDLQQKNRVFSYGNVSNSINSIGGIFLQPYNNGRFGDGNSYGVWYGALEEETAVLEALYHQWKRAQNSFVYNESTEVIVSERKMFRSYLKTDSCVDLSKFLSLKDRLIDDDHLFCNELGNFVFKNKIKLLITPSARNPGGHCTPAFCQSVIEQEKALYYLRWTFHRSGKIEREKISQEKMDFHVPKHWSKDREVEL